jgi:hypothetical protein
MPALATLVIVAAADVLSAAQLDALGPAATAGRGVTPSSGSAHALCFAAGVVAPDAAPRPRDVTIAVRALDAGEELEPAVRALVERDAAPERRRLLVTLTVRAVGPAIEAQAAPLAPTPLGVLRGGDVSGFFRACGTHYIRAVTREARYPVAVSYAADDTPSDAAFEMALRAALARFAAGEAVPGDEEGLADEAAARGLLLSVHLPGAAAPTSYLLPGEQQTLRAALDTVLGGLAASEPAPLLDAELAPWNQHPEVAAALAVPLDTPPPPPARELMQLDAGRRLDRGRSGVGASEASTAGATPARLLNNARSARRIAALTGGGTAGLALELRGEWTPSARPIGLAAHAALFAERGELALGIVPTVSRRLAEWRTFAGLGVGALLGGPDGAGAAGLAEIGGELPLARRWFLTGIGRLHVAPERAAFTLGVGLAHAL